MEVLANLNVEELLLDPRVAIVPVLLFLGAMLKNNTKLTNNLIPWVLTAIGIVAGLVFVELGAKGVLAGILYSAVAIYGHGLAKVKNEVKKSE